MKYIRNGSFGEYSVINQKVDLDNIHSFCILKTQSDDIVNKLNGLINTIEKSDNN